MDFAPKSPTFKSLIQTNTFSLCYLLEPQEITISSKKGVISSWTGSSWKDSAHKGLYIFGGRYNGKIDSHAETFSLPFVALQSHSHFTIASYLQESKILPPAPSASCCSHKLWQNQWQIFSGLKVSEPGSSQPATTLKPQVTLQSVMVPCHPSTFPPQAPGIGLSSSFPLPVLVSSNQDFSLL